MHHYVRPTSQRPIWWTILFISIIVSEFFQPYIFNYLEKIPNTTVRSLISLAIPAILGLWLFPWLYDHYIWKFYPFRRWEKIPHLCGKWTIHGQSSFEGGKPWEGTLYIEQNWDTMSIELKAQKSRSLSFSANVVKQSRNNYLLLYTYNNIPDATTDWAKHTGCAELLFDLKEKTYTGSYYNYPRDRQTWGTMKGELITKKSKEI